MKNTSLILSVIALVAVAALGIVQLTSGKKTAAPVATDGTAAEVGKGSIVYFNLDRVLQDYDMANELRSAVESKVQSINQEVTRRGNKLQSDYNSFQDKINKGLITNSVAQVQSQKLQQQQEDFQRYAAQKEQEINEEQTVMMNQIGDAIKTFIDKYNEEHQYALILTTQGDIFPSPVVTGEGALDITEDVITKLNEEYVKNKATENNSSK